MASLKIAELRKAKNMTQDALARESGVSRATIAGLESGAMEVTTTRTLEKLAHALGKEPRDLFFE